MTKPSWDQRIERAEELAQTYPFAAEMLRFYREITGYQKALYGDLQSARRENATEQVNLILPRIPSLLALVARLGPPPLAAYAKELQREGEEGCRRLTLDFWEWGISTWSKERFLVRVLLQPYAEYLADQTDKRLDYDPRTCPFCAGRPVAGVLRPEGYGARRSVVCHLCSREWDFPRIVCPACGESAFEKLPVFTADEFPHVRVEACDSCRRYIKTVDLTKNGLAVPVVDELATTPLNLWAEERGYSKVEPNLLGM